MLQILLTKYWVLVHLLVTTGTLCFTEASPGMALWGASALFLFMLALPPVLQGEGFLAARTRVWTNVKKDPLLYATLLACGYTGVQLLNAPRSLEYAIELKRWIFTPAPMEFFPSSIEMGAGASVFAGLVIGLVVAITIRNVLPRKQRLYFLFGLLCMVSLHGLTVTLLNRFVEGGLSGFWAPSYAYTLLWFMMGCVSLGVAAEAFLEGHWKTMYLGFITGAILLIATLACGCAGLAVVTLLLCVAWLAFAPFLVRSSGRYPRILWWLAFTVPVGLMIIIALNFSTPDSGWHLLLDLETWSEQLVVWSEQWLFRCGLAVDVWGTEPMLGVGPQGFDEMARFFIKGRASWALWRAEGWGGISCDFMRLLVERGMIGSLLLILPGFILLGGWMMRWVEWLQDTRHRYSYRYIFILIGSAIGVIVVLIGSLFGSPLHHPTLLCVWLILCAMLTGWMPRRR